jgi:hypothetical protein
MPANFLIVCGGAGRGILSRFDDLGFDGALQIDVQSELVQSNDGRVLTFGLPVSPIDDNPHSVASLGAYAVRLENEWKEHHTQNHHKGDYKECGEGDCQNYQRQVKHVATAIQGVVPTAISNGMSQNPIIGRSYITRPRVSQLLADTILRMSSLKAANQQDVVVWLVASTCGGTGNGIVHHVADLVRQVFGQYHLTVKFVRIGDATYVSMYPLTRVSTFWSVLTDYGYYRKYKDAILTGINNGGIHWELLHFYFIDVPDVGNDIVQREALVQSVFMTVCDSKMSIKFEHSLSTKTETTTKVIMARVGEWGNVLDRNEVYLLTLRQLADKLEHLLLSQDTAQSYARWLSETQSISVGSPTVVLMPDIQHRYQEVALRLAVQPVLKGLRSIQPYAFGRMTNVRQVQEHPKWQEMCQLVSQIFTETEIQNITNQVQVNLTIKGQVAGVNLGDHADAMGPMYIASRDHIGRVQMAQRAKARIIEYLNVYIEMKLINTWNAMIPGRFDSKKAQQARFMHGIVEFLTEYFKVARCLALYNEAEQIIQQAREDFSKVTDVIRHAVDNSVNISIPHQYTECAELDEMFGGTKTWLRILLDAPQKGDLRWAFERGEFRRAVELGANGLTEAGLKYVLQLPAEATIAQLVDEVNTNCGRNGAVWWQGMQQPAMWDGFLYSNSWFDYRIFPILSDKLFKYAMGSYSE